MTSRERVLNAINHKETDRVPIDLGATPSSTISAIAYNNLKKHLKITNGHTWVYDVVQQVVLPEEWCIKRFNVDVIDIAQAFLNDEEWYQALLPDGSRADYPKWFRPIPGENGSQEVYKNGVLIARMPQGATFYDQTFFPFLDGYPEFFENLDKAMEMVHWAALAHTPWDRANRKDFWTSLREAAKNLRENTDKALLIVCGCNLFEWGTFLRRMDNFLMDLYLEPKKVEALLDALLEIHLATLEKVCQSVGDLVDIIRLGDDLGMDTGPFMAPEIYRKFFKPRHKAMCDFIKKNSNMHIFLPSCGSIYKLIPDLIEAGFEILNPVQTSAKDMEPERLKREFGNDVVFWGGGCNTRKILNFASPQEVKVHVKKRLEVFSKQGGFIFNQEHNIMPDVPPENIVAMYEAIEEFYN
ncbi:MAG: methyltransferase [Candidatus Atribacteria bacterium]|nr:methyltransferase [Candidatus Atribacteria bacterium]MCD6350267.1 methyltransferase [Candidatus Atribacteria bacterium]